MIPDAPYIVEAERNGYPEGDPKYSEIMGQFSKMFEALHKAEQNIANAAGLLEGSSYEDRLMSIYNDLDDLEEDLHKIERKVEGGEY